MWFNPIMKWLIRSPLHGSVSNNMLLIGYAGHKSGKRYETPVNYVRDGDTLLVTSYLNRTWWRNLLGGAPVTVWLMGKRIEATAEAFSNQPDVILYLQAYLEKAPKQAKYFQVALDQQGHPDPADVSHAAQERAIVRIRLTA